MINKKYVKFNEIIELLIIFIFSLPFLILCLIDIVPLIKHNTGIISYSTKEFFMNVAVFIAGLGYIVASIIILKRKKFLSWSKFTGKTYWINKKEHPRLFYFVFLILFYSGISTIFFSTRSLVSIKF